MAITINGQLFSVTPAPSSVFGPVPGGRPTAEEIQRQREEAASKIRTATIIQPQPIKPLALPPVKGHVLADDGYRYKTIRRFRISRTHY